MNFFSLSRETIKTWINVLQASFIAYELPPFYKNYNKRLIKSPKLYFYDVGLLCYLLNVDMSSLQQHPLRGGVFENFIINEFIKTKFNTHRVPDFYFFRDSSGHEVDLVYEEKGKVYGVEIKSAQTFNESFLKGLKRFKALAGESFGEGQVIYAGDVNQQRGPFEVCSWPG